MPVTRHCSKEMKRHGIYPVGMIRLIMIRLIIISRSPVPWGEFHAFVVLWVFLALSQAFHALSQVFRALSRFFLRFRDFSMRMENCRVKQDIMEAISTDSSEAERLGAGPMSPSALNERTALQ